jgi:hypothetical protein
VVDNSGPPELVPQQVDDLLKQWDIPKMTLGKDE